MFSGKMDLTFVSFTELGFPPEDVTTIRKAIGSHGPRFAGLIYEFEPNKVGTSVGSSGISNLDHSAATRMTGARAAYLLSIPAVNRAGCRP